MTSELSPEAVTDLEDRLDTIRLKVHDLAMMGSLVTSIQETETILSVVMEMSIRMVEGEVGLIQLFEDGDLRSKVSWGVDENLVRTLIYKDNIDIATYCFQKQDSVILSDINFKVDLGLKIASVMAVPIKSRARCHGVVTIINRTNGEIFTEEDRLDLEMLVNFAAVAIDNSLLREESLKRQKLEQELAIAREVQETILPIGETVIQGVDIGTYYLPANEVGGDFYDIIKITDQDFWMVIGDVSNKGVPAAMVMSAATAIIKSELSRDPASDPSRLMAHLNDVLCSSIIKSQGMFVTLFLARFNMRDSQLEYCNAGHVQPLYWDISQNTVTELKTGGTFVGQFADIKYQKGERPFRRGDRIFAFTDGLTEAEDEHQGFFGVERAMQVFLAEKELPATHFCLRVKEWADRFREGARPDTVDDFTLVMVKIK